MTQSLKAKRSWSTTSVSAKCMPSIPCLRAALVTKGFQFCWAALGQVEIIDAAKDFPSPSFCNLLRPSNTASPFVACCRDALLQLMVSNWSSFQYAWAFRGTEEGENPPCRPIALINHSCRWAASIHVIACIRASMQHVRQMLMHRRSCC